MKPTETNGVVYVKANATAPFHKDGVIYPMHQNVADKMTANGWGEITNEAPKKTDKVDLKPEEKAEVVTKTKNVK